MSRVVPVSTARTGGVMDSLHSICSSLPFEFLTLKKSKLQIFLCKKCQRALTVVLVKLELGHPYL